MNDTPQKRDDEKARAEALFRYRVLVPLLDEHAGLSLRQRVAQRAAQLHTHPCGEQQSFAQRTLWTWLSRFRQGGLDALHPRHRKDKGMLRALPKEAMERAELLRRESCPRAGPARCWTFWCRISSAVADSGTIQALTSLDMAPKPRLNRLSAEISMRVTQAPGPNPRIRP